MSSSLVILANTYILAVARTVQFPHHPSSPESLHSNLCSVTYQCSSARRQATALGGATHRAEAAAGAHRSGGDAWRALRLG